MSGLHFRSSLGQMDGLRAWHGEAKAACLAASTTSLDPVKVHLPLEAFTRPRPSWQVTPQAPQLESVLSGSRRLPPETTVPHCGLSPAPVTPRQARTSVSLLEALTPSTASPSPACTSAFSTPVRSSTPVPNGTPPGLEQVLARTPVSEIQTPQQEVAVPPPPGLLPPEGMPSHGSVWHFSGLCRPCGWFWKAAGCQNGLDCQHCHFCPDGAAKQRKKNKQAAVRLQRALFKQSEATREAAAEAGADVESFGRRASWTPSTSAASDQEATPAWPDSEQDVQFVSEDERQDAADPEDGGVSDEESDSDKHVDVVHTNPGSLMHGAGQCQPCAWFWKAEGCSRGESCGFCHICPCSEIRARKKAKHAALRVARQLRRHAKPHRV